MARRPVGRLLGYDIEVFGTGGENLRRKHWPSPSGLEIIAGPEEAFIAIRWCDGQWSFERMAWRSPQ